MWHMGHNYLNLTWFGLKTKTNKKQPTNKKEAGTTNSLLGRQELVPNWQCLIYVLTTSPGFSIIFHYCFLAGHPSVSAFKMETVLSTVPTKRKKKKKTWRNGHLYSWPTELHLSKWTHSIIGALTHTKSVWHDNKCLVNSLAFLLSSKWRKSLWGSR